MQDAAAAQISASKSWLRPQQPQQPCPPAFSIAEYAGPAHSVDCTTYMDLRSCSDSEGVSSRSACRARQRWWCARCWASCASLRSWSQTSLCSQAAAAGHVSPRTSRPPKGTYIPFPTRSSMLVRSLCPLTHGLKRCLISSRTFYRVSRPRCAAGCAEAVCLQLPGVRACVGFHPTRTCSALTGEA